jgi:3-dehydroquinate dehydratase II
VRVLVLNGPNLGRLGTREPDIYGATTYDDLVALCRRVGAELGLDVDVRQTDHEGVMIGWLHEAADTATPVVLNAAAWTHYSVALADAAAQLSAPLVEVHISNVHAREAFRHHSYISAIASGVIVGLGVGGYLLALRWIAGRADT